MRNRRALRLGFAGLVVATLWLGPSPARSIEHPTDDAPCLDGSGYGRAVAADGCEIEIAEELLALAVLYDDSESPASKGWRTLHASGSIGGKGLAALDDMALASPRGLEARMRLHGHSGSLRYRGEYGLFRDGYDRQRRRTASLRSGARFESSVRWGPLEPKLEIGYFQKRRLRDDDEQARSLARASFDVRLPRLPVLTLGVGRETRSVRPIGRPDRERNAPELLTNQASATLWYGRTSWETYATSTYLQLEQTGEGATDGIMVDHIFSFTVRPWTRLSIVPLVEYTSARYPSADYETRSLTGSLGVYHAAFEGGTRSYVYGSYLVDRDSAGYVDARSIDVATGVEHDVTRWIGLTRGHASVGLEANVGRYQDLLYAEASTTTWGGFLRVRVQP